MLWHPCVFLYSSIDCPEGETLGCKNECALSGNETQDDECGIDLVRPPNTTPTYYGSLTASFCDCFNYQFSGLGNLRAPFSQSMRYSVVRALGGGGS